jgi:hypothetical protein
MAMIGTELVINKTALAAIYTDMPSTAVQL